MKFLSTFFRRFVGRVVAALVLVTTLLSPFSPAVSVASAATGINRQVSYQAKLLDTTGSPVADGTYQLKLSLYDAAAAGTRLWTATGTTLLPTALPISVVNGLFTVYLGDTSAAGGWQNALDGVDWNTDSIYLGVTVAADAEMLPRKRFTASPYAFNAERLQGMYASSSVFGTSNVFALNQTSNTAATGTRSTLEVRSQGTSNQNDFLIRGINDLNTPVLTVNRQGNVTTTGNLVAIGDVTAQNLNGVSASFTSLLVSGQNVCLANGTNCLFSSTTPTLQQVLNQGNVATSSIQIGGGTSTGNFVTTNLNVTGTATTTNLVLTNGTSTNLFATNSSSTNLNALNLTAANVNLLGGTAVLSAATSTQFIFTNATGSMLNVTTLTATDGTVTNVTSTNASIARAVVADVIWTNATGTNTTSTNLFAINLTGTNASVTSLLVGGQLPCLADGTNCLPTAPSSATLQTVTNQGNTTTNAIQFAGGTSTAGFVMTNATSTGWFGFATASGTTLTALNLNSSNATITGGAINGTVIGNLTPAAASFTNVTGTNVTSTNVFATNASLTNLAVVDGVFTRVTSTQWLGFATASGTDLNWINATGTNAFVSNLSGLSASFTSLLVSGQAVCLLDGTNCPAGSTTPTLQQVLNQGNTATTTMTFGGGTSTGNFVTTNLNVTGTATILNSTTTNATSTNLASVNALFVNVNSSNATITNVVFSNATVTDLAAVNAVFTGSTSTNLFAATASSTNLTALNLTSNNVTILGGTLNGTSIGDVTPSTAVFTMVTATQATTTNLAVTGAARLPSISTVNGVLICLADGTNCMASTGDSVWFDHATAGLIRPNTTTRSVVMGASATSTGAPVYFEATGAQTGSSTLFVGFATNTNLVVGTTTNVISGMNPSFVLNGNDIYAEGNIGSASSIYTNGEFVVGTGTTRVADGLITKTNGNLSLAISGGFLLPNADLAITLGSSTLRFNGLFGSVTTTNATSTNFYAGNLNAVSASFTAVTIGGQSPCLEDGTDCPTGVGTPNLQDVTNAGNVTTNTIQFAGGTSTGNFTVQGTLTANNFAVSGTLSILPTLTQKSSSASGFSPTQTVIRGDFMYVIEEGNSSLSIYDISNASVPKLLYTTASGFSVRAIDVVGDLLLLAQDYQFTILDVSNPRNPVRLGGVSFGTVLGNTRLVSHGNFVYVMGSGSSNFHVFNIANPASPVEVGTPATTVASLAGGFDTDGRYVYLMSGTTFEIVDVRNPTSSVSVYSTTTGGTDTRDLAVQGGYAYVPFSASTTVRIYDVTSSTNPLFVSDINTGVGNTVTDSYPLEIAGKYLFVGHANGINVYDVSNPASPSLVASTSLSQAHGLSVSGRILSAINGSDQTIRLYDIGGADVAGLAAQSAQVGNLAVRDRATVGSDLAVRGAVTVGEGGVYSQGAITVTGTGTHSTVGGSLDVYGQLRSNGQLVCLADGTNCTGGGGGSSTPTLQQVLVQGNVATSSMTFGGGTSTGGFVMTDATSTGWFGFATASGTTLTALNLNANNVTILGGTATFSSVTSTNGMISNLVMTNSTFTNLFAGFGSANAFPHYATITTGVLPAGIALSNNTLIVPSVSGYIQLVDVSNPYAPSTTAYLGTGFSWPYHAFAAGRYAYISDRSNNTFSVVDIANPSAPVNLGQESFASGLQASWVAGKYAYVADEGGTLSVVDVADPTNPTTVGSVSIGSYGARGIVVRGRYAYIAGHSVSPVGALVIVDIENPLAPTVVATLTLSAGTTNVDVSGNFAYLSNETAGTISVVDVSIPNSPALVATINPGQSVINTKVIGHYLLATLFGSDEVAIYDIQDPAAPVLQATRAIGDGPNAFAVKGRQVYVSLINESSVTSFDMGGMETTGLHAQSADIGSLNVQNNAQFGNNVSIVGGLNVGAGGIYSEGPSNLASVVSSDLTWTNATGTNTTSTNLFATNASSTNLRALNLSAANVTFVDGTSTQWFGFVTASGTNLFATNGYFTDVTSTEWLGYETASGTSFFALNASTTNFYSDNASSTNFSSINATSSWLGFDTASGTNLFAFAVTATNLYADVASSTLFNAFNATTVTMYSDISSSTILNSMYATSAYMYADNASATYLNAFNATSVYSYADNASSTNLSAINATSAWLGFDTASGTDLFGINGYFTDVTSTEWLGYETASGTNFFSLNATSANMYVDNIVGLNATFTNLVVNSPLSFTDLLWTNATGSTLSIDFVTTTNLNALNATSNNFYSDNASTTILNSMYATSAYMYADNASATYLNAFNATSVYSYADNASSTNLSAINATSAWLGFDTASGTNLFGINGYFTDVTSTEWLGFETASGTTLNALNLSATNVTFVSGTSTEWFGFETASGTNLFAFAVTATNLYADVASSTLFNAFNATTVTMYSDISSSTIFNAMYATSAYMYADNASATYLNAFYATSVYSYADSASSTNLSAINATSAWLGFDTASGTNLFAFAVTATNLYADVASSTILNSMYATSVYSYADSASSTNLSAINATSAWLGFDTASGTNLFGINGYFTDVTSTEWLGFETASGTTLNALNLSATNVTFVSGTSTEWFGFETASGTNLFAFAVTATNLYADVASSTLFNAFNATTVTMYSDISSSTIFNAMYATSAYMYADNASATLFNVLYATATNLAVVSTDGVWGTYLTNAVVGPSQSLPGAADFTMAIAYDGSIRAGLCIDDLNDAGDCLAGPGISIQADNAINASAFDLAEWYRASGSVTSSDVLIWDTSATATVKVSEAVAYDSRVMGIASTKPGFLLGDAGDVRVALSGRVPTKISMANGAVKVGDLLTTSPYPGYVMKATKPGMTVGYALENLSATGTMEVFVKVGYSAGTVLSVVGNESTLKDSLVFAATSTASSTNVAVDSYGMTFRGSAWDAVSSTEVMSQFSLLNDVLSATQTQFTVLSTTGSSIFTLTQVGDLSIAGRFFPGTRTGMQSGWYIFADDSVPSSTYMATNADGWQANDSYDFAERYYSPEPLEAGELVVASRSGQFHVQKSSQTTELLMGIVSTKPAFVAGRPATNTYPIALAGRVPTKVSAMNGAIRVNDPLGPSTIPGVAMKVTTAGPIVGYALEDYADAMVGSIEVYVNPGWFGGVLPVTQEVMHTSTQQIAAGSALRGYATILAGAKQVQVRFASINSYPNVTVTPYGEVGTWWVSNVTDQGFTIVMTQALDRDTRFAWKVEATEESAQEALSDGTHASMNAMTGQTTMPESTTPEPVVEQPVVETVTTTTPIATTTEMVTE